MSRKNQWRLTAIKCALVVLEVCAVLAACPPDRSLDYGVKNAPINTEQTNTNQS
jgi:hypothetical protein